MAFTLETKNMQYIESKVVRLFDGIQKEYKFPNGYGASIVCHKYSYGGNMDLWEGAVLDSDGHLCYTTHITDDVVGYMDLKDISEFLDKVAAL